MNNNDNKINNNAQPAQAHNDNNNKKPYILTITPLSAWRGRVAK